MIRKLRLYTGRIENMPGVVIEVRLLSVHGMIFREEGFTDPIVIRWEQSDESRSPDIAIERALSAVMREFEREVRRGLDIYMS